jgi:hypothetical protein
MSKPDLKAVDPEKKAAAPGADELKALVAKDKAERLARAKSRIDAILAEERCQLVPLLVLTTGNVTGRIDIQVLD